MQNGTGETSRLSPCNPPPRRRPLPTAPWSPPGGQAAFQTVSDTLLLAGLSTAWEGEAYHQPRGVAGKPRPSPRGLFWARSPHLTLQGGQTWPPSRASRLVETQPWSFCVVGTVVSGAGAGRHSSGRTGWGTDLSGRVGGKGGVAAGWTFRQRLDRCKGRGCRREGGTCGELQRNVLDIPGT